MNVSSDGPFSNFSVIEIAGGTIDPGADVNLTCCGFNTVSFVAGSAGATGNIDVHFGQHPITGNVPAGISIDIEAAGGWRHRPTTPTPARSPCSAPTPRSAPRTATTPTPRR